MMQSGVSVLTVWYLIQLGGVVSGKGGHVQLSQAKWRFIGCYKTDLGGDHHKYFKAPMLLSGTEAEDTCEKRHTRFMGLLQEYGSVGLNVYCGDKLNMSGKASVRATVQCRHNWAHTCCVGHSTMALYSMRDKPTSQVLPTKKYIKQGALLKNYKQSCIHGKFCSDGIDYRKNNHIKYNFSNHIFTDLL